MNCLGTKKDIIGITSAIANKAWVDKQHKYIELEPVRSGDTA